MLQKLHIINYAIIEELEISFNDRLNIITGETGAGKSILMGALGLILGERADSTVLQQKDKKCVVEGSFNTKNQQPVLGFLAQNDLDAGEDLVIRREITTNGKSRAFVNDTPVNLNQLKGLCTLLVDLHQQFDTLELGNSGFQQQVLDALAGNGELLLQYNLLFHQYIFEKKGLEQLQEQQRLANTALDYHTFLFDELNSLGLRENELEDLDTELKLLSNTGEVKQQLESICKTLNDDEQPIVQQLKVLGNKLQGLEQYHAGITPLAKRLLSTQVELQDIAEELERINENTSYSAERIQVVNDRVSAGYKLLKKHGVHATVELLAIKDGLQQKLNEILNISGAIHQKEKNTAELKEQCGQKAKTISANRKKALPPFTQKVNGLLVKVGMPNAGFRVDLQQEETIGENGCDRTIFLFNANLTVKQADIGLEQKEIDLHFVPLRKVASGGELSRLMLCIKSLVAKQVQLPTLIFDEIDTGISGEAARQVGNIMKELSGAHQVISITHQPQIAARADAHFFVYKSIDKDRIITSVRVLSTDERITTIAQMLSGEKPTAAALQNAREMVGN